MARRLKPHKKAQRTAEQPGSDHV